MCNLQVFSSRYKKEWGRSTALPNCVLIKTVNKYLNNKVMPFENHCIEILIAAH